MAASSVSHDYTVVHPLRVVETQPVDIQPVDTDTNESNFTSRIRSVASRIRNIPHFRAVETQPVDTQPVDTDTNESNFTSRIRSVASRIRNMPHYAYRGTKAAVKYTNETINAYPRIALSISIVALVAYVALSTCCHTLYVNQASALSIVAPLTLTEGLVTGLVTGLVLMSLTVYDYQSYINGEESHQEGHPRIITFCKLIAAIITSVVSAFVLVALADLDHTDYTTRRADDTIQEPNMEDMAERCLQLLRYESGSK